LSLVLEFELANPFVSHVFKINLDANAMADFTGSAQCSIGEVRGSLPVVLKITIADFGNSNNRADCICDGEYNISAFRRLS